ncbi:hypothetical protein ABW20_dc0100744 [Dactylellina cionopaga]|nr:hypothetical protein ABW20_dc0100744 [Dactylellina cionopaga]
MARAINSASDDGVLIFAAASNHGSLKPIAFPAWMYKSARVMCMFASDGFGKAKNKFNPPPLGSEDNFALLGKDVPVISHPTKETESGTSVATFVGAAVAAIVLDFARQEGVNIRSARKLKHVNGISAVFKEMARDGKDDKYDCVVPSKLLPGAGTPRKDYRTAVCEKLSVALDKAWA